jgi:superfamily II DNA or RNA helicase
LKEISDDSERVVLATGRYVGEGFDDPRLDTLLMAFLISRRGTLQQYVGRRRRTHANKKEVQVFGYVDQHAPVLARMPTP